MTTSTPCGHDHLAELVAAASSFAPSVDVADRWGSTLADALPGGARVLAAGNGGSAAQAQHLTAELVGRYREDRRPFSGISLCAETSSLTAIGNDYAPTELFARQVEAHGRPGDVLVLMSTSGTSPNILEAARRGTHGGLTVWAFTGPRPNPLAQLADESLSVDAHHTATVQELHLVALHIMCAALDRALGVAPARSGGPLEGSRRSA